MSEIERCPACRVPKHITQEHIWLNSGAIVQRSDQTGRLAFIESESLDPLYAGIDRLVGVPIEHIVTEAARRTTRTYMGQLVPRELKDLVQRREVGVETIVDLSFQIAHIMGYGDAALVGFRYEEGGNRFITIRVSQPYSAPLFFGNFVGTVEAVMEEQSWIAYREISPGVYEATVRPFEHPPELKERLRIMPYRHRDGHAQLERCGTCGGPLALSAFEWDVDRGVIRSKDTGRRMALLGSEMLDPFFNELEGELGEIIPQAVVEAQRRLVKNGLYPVSEIVDEEAIRSELALRGLGELRELRIGRSGIYLRLDNATLRLLVAGVAQGLYELAFGVDSEVAWQASEEGNLEVEVKPRA